MRSLLIVSLLLLLTNSISCQEIFIQESNVIDTLALPRKSNSYQTNYLKINKDSVLKVEDVYPIGLFWNSINHNEIIGCNSYTIGKLNLEEESFDTLYESNSVILEMSANEESCILVTCENEQNRFKSPKLLRLNLTNMRIDTIIINDTINFLNLNLSKTGKKISFISRSILAKNSYCYYYNIYDFETKKLTTINSAYSRRQEYFARIDDGPLTYWIDDTSLLYYKKDSENGTIYTYDINNKNHTRRIDVPIPRIKCFSFYSGCIFFIRNGNSIIAVDKSNKKHNIYKVKYKYDYLSQRFYIN